MENPKVRLYRDGEVEVLLQKAARLGYPLDDPNFYDYCNIWQLDEIITYGRYDC